MDKKSDSWIIAARPDGFGQRFCSILVGLYLAKKLQFNFGFVWENSIDIKADLSSKNDKNKNFLGVAMDKAELIFGENFIKNYLLNPSIDSWVDSYSHPLTYGMRIMKKAKTFKQLKQKSRFDRKWGYYACPYLPSDFLVDCERKECLEELGNIYKSIPFSKEFTDIQKRVHDISLSLNHNFIALHIRGGEVVFSHSIRQAMHSPILKERFFPYEIALELAQMELKANNHIIIFGQDIQANHILANHLKSFKEFSHLNVKTCEEFFDKKLNDTQRAFFELNLMARAFKVYSTKNSGFAGLIRMISADDRIISYDKIFSSEKQFEIIKENIQRLKFHNLQIAASYFKLFDLNKNLKKPIQESLEYLLKALEFDKENMAYRIFIMKEFFNQNKYKEIDSMLKNILQTQAKEFLQTMLSPIFGEFECYFYDYVYFDDENFPYIVFMGSKICEFFRFSQRKKYLRLCYLKNEQERKNLLNLEKMSIPKYFFRSYKSNVRLALRLHRKIYKSQNITKKEYFNQIPLILMKALKDSFKQKYLIYKLFILDIIKK